MFKRMSNGKINKYKLVWPLLLMLCAVGWLCGCNGLDPVSTIESLIPVVSTILTIAGTVVEGLLPAESSLIGAGITLVTNGLNSLLGTLQTYEANKSAPGALNAVQGAFNALHANLASLLAAGQVKNPVTTQKITGIVNGIISVIATVEAYIISKAKPSVVAAASATAPTAPTLTPAS